MENTAKFHIGCQNVESYNKMIISVGNYVATEGNTLLRSDEIEMLVVLHNNSEFVEFIRSKYSNFSRQLFNMTIIRSDGEDSSIVGFKFVRQMKCVLLCTMI